MDAPGSWDKGRLESEPEEHHDTLLGTYYTGDVRDSSGELHEDVTIIHPDKE